ncbi:hypothetical protein [Sphingomonas sp. MMS24-J13]|uniref:hypothetical protein n=1 Tax=Sphingomonas sp. MMS24-J13 TaxID=3238686 RepID=UPI00384E24A9
MAAAAALWQRRGMEAVRKRQRMIPAWKLAGGIFLHLTVPAYLLTLAVVGTSAALHGRSLAAMLGQIVHLSGWFLFGYTLLGVASVAGLALAEHGIGRWRGRRETPPTPQARQSAARLDHAVATGHRVLAHASAPALHALSETAWDHADPRIQALTADLAELLDRTAVALASAPRDRRDAIAKLGLESLDHIAASFAALAAERSRLDEGDVRVIARYVEARYGTSDFSSDG